MNDLLGNTLKPGMGIIYPTSSRLRVGVVLELTDRVVIDTGGNLGSRDPTRVVIYSGASPTVLGCRVAFAANGVLLLGELVGRTDLHWEIESRGEILYRTERNVRRV